MRYSRLGLSVALLLNLLTGCPDDSGPSPAAAGSGAGGAAGRGHSAMDTDAGVEGEPSKPQAGTGGGKAGGSAGQAGKAGQPAAGSGGKAAGGSPASDKPGSDTGSATRFWLPTGEPTNTTAPVLRADASGATHLLYPTYGSGGAFYAYCGKSCTGMNDVKPVLLATEGTVGNAALALTADGKPRVLLSTLLRVYYGQCDKDCSDKNNWTLTAIDEHQGDRDVTGQALALDPQGHPRFIEHTYLAFLGVGQLAPKTWYVTCDSNCNDASSWQRSEIYADKIWYESQLKIDAAGRAHVLTGVENVDGMSAGIRRAAYLECDGQCTTPEAWNGSGLAPLYESHTEQFKDSLSLALTKQGKPRLLLIDRGGDNGGKRLLFFECDDQCTEDKGWKGSVLSDLKQLGPGVDLTVDDDGHPRFVFTLDSNIGLYRCDSASCTADDAKWDLIKVEFASDLPKDTIILWPNCTVDAWILHEPSLALAADGSVRVGYQATDLSGGVRTVDPTKPACVAGKDMTLSRMAIVSKP